MSKIPRDVQLKIKEIVYKKADEHGYLNKGRPDNSSFMENLIKDPTIGGVLSEFMTKVEIKTYIKDAILNRYSKDKVLEELSSGAEKAIIKVFNIGSNQIEIGNRVSFHRLENNDLVILAEGTLLKWETALRKALEFIEKSPGLPPEDCELHILLNLAVSGKLLTDADRKKLNSILSIVNVRVIFSDDL